jgi:hypothetical protein
LNLFPLVLKRHPGIRKPRLAAPLNELTPVINASEPPRWPFILSRKRTVVNRALVHPIASSNSKLTVNDNFNLDRLSGKAPLSLKRLIAGEKNE